MRNRIIAFVFLTVLATSAFGTPAGGKAFSWTGNSWMAMCGPYPTVNELADLHCEAFTHGAIEGAMWGYLMGQKAANPKADVVQPFCLSGSQTISQYIMVIRKSYSDFPQALEMPAASFIKSTLSSEFPCHETK